MLVSGQIISDSVTIGNWKFYKIEKNGANSIQVDMTQLSSDVDLYVRKQYAPSDSEGGFDCRPYKGGTTSEYCSVLFDTSNVIHIGVHGWSSGSFKLKASLVGGDVSNDDCLFKSSMLLESVEDIPCLMREKGWELASELMDYWFSGSGNNFNMELSQISNISEETANAIDDWEEKANNYSLLNQGMWEHLITELKNTPNNSGGMVLPDGGEFNHIQTEIPQADEGWMDLPDEQHKSSGMHWFESKGISEDILSEYGAAFGEGVLRLVANGEVIINNGHVTINVLEVGIYFRDSYDFIGGQFLGWWSYDSPYVSLLPTLPYPIWINNAAFRGFNESLGREGKHGDFRIFSNIKRIYTNESYYDYEIDANQGDPDIESFYNEYPSYFGEKSGGNYSCYSSYTCQDFANGKIIAVHNQNKSLHYNTNGTWHLFRDNY
jgi:hypothetical protein